MTIAMREAGEEAGYTTDNLDFRWGTQSKAVTGKKGKTGTFFVAHSDVDPALKRNPENNMLEHGGFKWVTWDDMLGNVGRFWFSDAIGWARNLVDSSAADGLEESLLRTWVREILAEAPRRGKRHNAARREREELESQGIFPTEEEKPKETKRDLWHIGPKPAYPQPKMKYLQDWDSEAIGRDGEKGDFVSIPGTDNWQRWWLDSPVKAGVFLTPTPTDIARYHGRSGNVYHYKVPEWVIAKSGGVHRYDHGSELLISKEIWDEAGDEIEFVGTSMTKDQLWQKIRDLGGYDFGGRVKPPGKSKSGSFNLYGLRQTKHPRDAIKLMKPEARQAAWEAFQELYPTPSGQNPEMKWEKVPGGRRGIPLSLSGEWVPPKDRELMDLLKPYVTSVNEAMIRQYVREALLMEASGGRVLDQLTNQMSRSIIDILKDPQVRKRHAEPQFKEHDDGSKEPIPLNLVLGNERKGWFARLLATIFPSRRSQKFSGGMDPELLDNLENVDRIVIRVFAAEPDEPGDIWWNTEAAYIINTQDRSKSDLEVALWLPVDYDFKIFSALIPELKETIRHELEHGVQTTEKLQGGEKVDLSLKGGESKHFKNRESMIDFYIKGGELEAYVTGLYKKAKSLRAPASEVIDEFLTSVYYRATDAGMTEEEASAATGEIRQQWYDYLVKRYPEAEKHLE